MNRPIRPSQINLVDLTPTATVPPYGGIMTYEKTNSLYDNLASLLKVQYGFYEGAPIEWLIVSQYFKLGYQHNATNATSKKLMYYFVTDDILAPCETTLYADLSIEPLKQVWLLGLSGRMTVKINFQDVNRTPVYYSFDCVPEVYVLPSILDGLNTASAEITVVTGNPL